MAFPKPENNPLSAEYTKKRKDAERDAEHAAYEQLLNEAWFLFSDAAPEVKDPKWRRAHTRWRSRFAQFLVPEKPGPPSLGGLQ